MKTLFELYLANLKEFFRERMSIFWTLAFPVVFMLLFGIIFTGNGTTTFNIGVVNQDQGQAGVNLTKAFQSINAFKVTTGSQATLLSSLRKGDLDSVITIPSNLSSSIASGKQVSIDIYYDPTDQVVSQVLLPVVDKVIQGFNQQITHQSILINASPKTITATNLTEIDFLLPGILGMSLMQLGLFGTATVLVQQREQQVLRRLGATPLPRFILLTSQVLFRLTIGLMQAAVIILIGVWVFHVRILGNAFLLAGIIIMGTLMFVALGYMISGLARSQDSVAAITNLINFPMMILSGIFFPITIMPGWIRPVVDAMPLTYLADLLRQLMVNSPPSFSLSLDLGVITGWLVVCSLLSIKLFRWE
jgi:ABC-2 type transport system permease protein